MDKKYPCKDCIILGVCSFVCRKAMESIEAGVVIHHTGNDCPFCGHDTVEELWTKNRKIRKCTVCLFRYTFIEDNSWTRK